MGGRKVMYTIENHLFHPAKGAPQKRDDLHRKKGTLLVPFLRCPPSILMGNGGGTPPPPSLFTGAHFGSTLSQNDQLDHLFTCYLIYVQ